MRTHLLAALWVGWMFGPWVLAQEATPSTTPPPEETQPTPNDSVDTQSQPSEIPSPAIQSGRITGDNVRVRSGPGTGYYEVTRLNKGERVQVVESKFGWVAIKPTKNCFSLIAKEYIDPDQNNKGVVNGDRVAVRPGSDSYQGPYYAKQTHLDRGQSVTLLGELGEYYKIPPPDDARVYVSADFVQIVSDAESASQETTPELTQTHDTNLPEKPKEKIDTRQYQKQIDAIEVDLQQEFQKDIFSRQLQSFIERFSKIAKQTDDDGARQYAEVRIEQLVKVTENIRVVGEMRRLSTDIENGRNLYNEQRAGIKPAGILQGGPEFDIRGKMLRSSAYTNPIGPRRFRLVDPADTSDYPHTIAYVEIEQGSSIDPETFLGRYVGVRSKGYRLVEGTVEPIKVYVASDIVILEQPLNPEETPTPAEQPSTQGQNQNPKG